MNKLVFKKNIKKFIIMISFVILFIVLSACAVNLNKKDEIEKLYVYNWGLYLEPSVIEEFEKKYNCKVIYDTYDTNEEMYVVVKEGARVYDVLCPTDYMVEKMIKKGLLYSYDIKTLPNYNNIDKRILNIMKSFDKDNVYAVPYVHSTLGLIYNKTELDRMGLPYPKKWADLWDESYNGEILLQDAMRDLLMVGLKKNHFSMNTLDQDELDIATGDLIKQKHLVNAYLIDPLRDKMVAGDGTIASMYSGEVEYIRTEGSKYQYEYILPEEGVNFTMDVWVIPTNAKNKTLAKKWIDYMLDPNVALKNYDYMHYGIANVATIALIGKRDGINVLNDESIFPNLDDIDKYEIYKDLGSFEENYNDAFKKIKS